jgi:hypothetical protein
VAAAFYEDVNLELSLVKRAAMKKLTTLLLFCFIIVFPALSATTPFPLESAPVTQPLSQEALLKKIASMRVRDFQKMTGKKLTLKQKIGFLLLKRNLRHKAKATANPGQTSLTFGIAAIIMLVLGFFVAPLLIGALIASIVAIVVGGSALQKDRSDRKARAGKLLGWLTLAILALLLILAAIVVASNPWLF